jgi:hypothetical protein
MSVAFEVGLVLVTVVAVPLVAIYVIAAQRKRER